METPLHMAPDWATHLMTEGRASFWENNDFYQEVFRNGSVGDRWAHEDSTKDITRGWKRIELPPWKLEND